MVFDSRDHLVVLSGPKWGQETKVSDTSRCLGTACETGVTCAYIAVVEKSSGDRCPPAPGKPSERVVQRRDAFIA